MKNKCPTIQRKKKAGLQAVPYHVTVEHPAAQKLHIQSIQKFCLQIDSQGVKRKKTKSEEFCCSLQRNAGYLLLFYKRMFAIKIDLHTKQAIEYTLYLPKVCFSQEGDKRPKNAECSVTDFPEMTLKTYAVLQSSVYVVFLCLKQTNQPKQQQQLLYLETFIRQSDSG